MSNICAVLVILITFLLFSTSCRKGYSCMCKAGVEGFDASLDNNNRKAAQSRCDSMKVYWELQRGKEANCILR